LVNTGQLRSGESQQRNGRVNGYSVMEDKIC